MDSTILNQSYYGLTLVGWIELVAVWLVITAAMMVFRRVFFSRFARMAERTNNRVDDVIASLLHDVKTWFLAIVALYIAVRWRTEDAPATVTILRIAFLGLLVQTALWANGLIRIGAGWYTEKRMDDPAHQTAINALVLIGNILIWSIVLLMALDNFGIDVTALIAGLGIGGIAIALALQNVLQDLLAYFSIIADRPFVYGDFLDLGELSGTVEHVGIKTTRLRSISGEQLVISNSDLLSSRIRNYQRMNERRIVFSVGVEYDTPHDMLKAIPDMLKSAVSAQEPVRFDRSHLKAFGDSSINFETVYYMTVPEYAQFMDTQHAINLDIHSQFEDKGIVFAFPTRTIHIESMPAMKEATSD